jgi:2-oxoglutarate ferredoxin oxidoreductase subunit beta
MVYPKFPECVGVFRAVQRPVYEDMLNEQIDSVIKAKGKGKLEDLFASEDTWVVQ